MPIFRDSFFLFWMHSPSILYVQYLLYCKKNILKNGLKMYILNSFVGVDHTE